MSKLENFIDSELNKALDNHRIITQKNVEAKNSNITTFTNIKNVFQKKFNELIDSISLLPEIPVEDSDESPASMVVNKIPTFADGSNIYHHSTPSTFKTFTLPDLLPACFEIPIKMTKITVGYLVCGVSNKVMDENRGYLGGDMGQGNWGIASNGSLGENGSWKSGKAFNTGDVLTLKGENGVITYAVNGEFQTYQFDLGTSELYLAFTFYYEDEIELGM